MEELGSSCADFKEILDLEVLLKSVKKIQVWFKLGRSKKNFKRKPTYIRLPWLVTSPCLPWPSWLPVYSSWTSRPWKMKKLQFFLRSGTYDPKLQHHIPEEWKCQPQ